jgi:hypothetical protein
VSERKRDKEREREKRSEAGGREKRARTKERKTHDGVGLDENVAKVRPRHDDLQQLMPQAGAPDGKGTAGFVGLDGPVIELGGGGDVGVVEVEVGEPSGKDQAVHRVEKPSELPV